MFDKIKKFARKHRHESIIFGIVFVVTGAFLAWLVNVAFLAMIFLSFIWTGYIFFETRYKDGREIFNGALGHHPQTNALINADITGEITNTGVADVTSEMVDEYIRQLKAMGKDNIVDNTFIVEKNMSILCDLLKEGDQGRYGNDCFLCIVGLHLHKIPWNVYSPEQISRDIKQIAGIMTGKTVGEINQYLYEYQQKVGRGENGTTQIEFTGYIWTALGCIEHYNEPKRDECVNVITLANVIDKVLERREKILQNIHEVQLTEILNARKLGPVPRIQKFGDRCLYEIEQSLGL